MGDELSELREELKQKIRIRAKGDGTRVLATAHEQVVGSAAEQLMGQKEAYAQLETRCSLQEDEMQQLRRQLSGAEAAVELHEQNNALEESTTTAAAS